MTRTVGAQLNKELLAIARANGARVVQGKKHVKIYNGKQLILVLSYGSHRRDRVPGGTRREALKRFKAAGWEVPLA